ncbi:MAG: hypothetical protein OEQ13_07945 [Acidobacteriota bacterium]|nr:hypothetical protein [Acidobacteriota bacterium]
MSHVLSILGIPHRASGLAATKAGVRERVERYPALALVAVTLFSGCATLPDVTTFASATQTMNTATEEAFVAASDVLERGMLATLDEEKGNSIPTDTSALADRELRAACESPNTPAGSERPAPRKDPKLRAVRTSLICMELSHRRLGLFQDAAATYAGSLEKVARAGATGKRAAGSLVSSVDGIGDVVKGSDLIGAGAAKAFSAFYAAMAKRGARKKLEKAIPATDLVIADLAVLLTKTIAALEQSVDAGSDALRTRLLADSDRWLVATSVKLDRSRSRAKGFLLRSMLEPEDPDELSIFVEELEEADEALARLNASVVIDCHDDVRSLDDVVCRTTEVAVVYTGGTCANDEEGGRSACCRVNEGCCELGQCRPFSQLLEDRIAYWRGRVATLATIEEEFPIDRLVRFQKKWEDYSATDRNVRRLLSAARLSIASWRRAHGMLAGAVKPKDQVE